MTATSTYKPPKFKVIANRAAGFTGTWTITEDNRFDCPGNWNTRQGAVSALARCTTEADRITESSGACSCGSAHIYLGGERITLALPYGYTPKIRIAVIHTAAMQWFIDQEPGDTP